jgi:hypothetical protein
MSSKLLLLFKLLFDLRHLLAYTVVGTHSKTLSYELDTKDKEQDGGGIVCETFGKECWHGVAQHGRENGHDDQSGESSGED